MLLSIQNTILSPDNAIILYYLVKICPFFLSELHSSLFSRSKTNMKGQLNEK